jgi:hypothetical protein
MVLDVVSVSVMITMLELPYNSVWVNMAFSSAETAVLVASRRCVKRSLRVVSSFRRLDSRAGTVGPEISALGGGKGGVCAVAEGHCLSEFEKGQHYG